MSCQNIVRLTLALSLILSMLTGVIPQPVQASSQTETHQPNRVNPARVRPKPAPVPLRTDRDVCPSGCTYSSIQAAIDAAAPGDTVQVAAGTYNESLTLDKAVSLLGADAETTLVQASSGRVLTVNGGGAITASTVISGFTFTGGSAAQGGGLYIDGDAPLVASNIISGNSATSEGGGVYAVGISESVPVRLEENVVRGNGK